MLRTQKVLFHRSGREGLLTEMLEISSRLMSEGWPPEK
jgi:hypothetical protein